MVSSATNIVFQYVSPKQELQRRWSGASFTANGMQLIVVSIFLLI